MPNRFQKAIRAFKDQTSISLAIVNGSSNLQVAVLRATSHDDLPIDELYVRQILQLISSDKSYASACAKAIRRRLTRTRNWVVALKSLMLVLRIFQDGDLYFPREVLHATKKGERLLNLSGFCDYSSSTPEDYTGFVRTFGSYLEERLDCILTGKLQRRYTYNERQGSKRSKNRSNDYIREMKPAMLIDRIVYWQRLLERAIATRPAGVEKDNQLVKMSVYAVVRESFDLYRDIADGLTYLLDNLLKLQHESCVRISDICVKAEKQFDELAEFYSVCQTIGVGDAGEYPTVQIVSSELVERLQEFLEEKTALPEGGSLSNRNELSGFSSSPGKTSDELTSAIEMGQSPSISIDLEANTGEIERRSQQEEPSWSIDNKQKEKNQEKTGGFFEAILDNELSDTSSVDFQCEQTSRKDWEFVLAEIMSPLSHTHTSSFVTSATSQAEGLEPSSVNSQTRKDWEFILEPDTRNNIFGRYANSQVEDFEAFSETPTRQQLTRSINILPNTFHAITLQNLQSQSQPTNHYNPFLQDLYDIPADNSCIASYWAQNQTKATYEQFKIETA